MQMLGDQRLAVVRAREAHRLRETPRAIRSVTLDLSSAHEHRVASAFAFADDVEALVHAVDEKHVRGARRAEERLRSLREARARVTREIARTAVRLRLYDARDLPRVHDACADERARDHERITREERTLESRLRHRWIA